MILSPTATDLEAIIAGYENAARTGSARINEFLPPHDSAIYPLALRELIRVDMEFGWSSRKPRRVEDYLEQYPQIRNDSAGLSDICFEEYRLRQAHGERPDPAAYRKLFHVDTSQWPIVQPNNDALAQRATDYLNDSTMVTAGGVDKVALTDLPTRLFVELHDSDQSSARHMAEALTSFPSVGDSFMGFELVDELGRGAFSRVYLAQERAVDGRRVALKVTGDMRSEVKALARLRHTNIAPVYSVKATGPFHAVCMPFCGSVTLSELIQRLFANGGTPTRGQVITRVVSGESQQSNSALWQHIDSLSYVDAVLALAARLAEGLAHAHERGICHRDIKPANVLLADDGEPLLLDFNLATEVSPAGSVTAAFIGGTLPYMAPEQLQAFRTAKRAGGFTSDVYSFGLVLFEWLTGKLPHSIKSDELDVIVDRLIAERLQAPINIRDRNPSLTPSLAAIIATCLNPDPLKRYPSARELADDLARQRDYQPLKHVPEPCWRERLAKWAHRHPRLSSSVSISFLSALLTVGLGVATWSIYRDRTALAQRENLRLFTDEYQLARLNLAHPNPNADTLRRGMSAATSAWKRIPAASAECKTERGTLALLMAQAQALAFERNAERTSLGQADEWNRRALTLLGPDAKVVGLQADWLQKLAAGQSSSLESPELGSTDDREMGAWFLARRQPRQALLHLIAATRHDPDSMQAWWLRGLAEQSLGMSRPALSSFTTCLALRNDLPDLFHARAVALMQLGKFLEAITDLEKTLELDGDSLNAIVDRGICRFELNQLAGADADISAAIDRGYPETRLFFLRARIRDKMNRSTEAEQDRQTGLAREPNSEADWSARALAHLPRQPQEALKDLDECLQRFPKSVAALQNRAYVCDEFLKDSEQAIAALTAGLRWEPENGHLLASRGVLFARRGDYPQARADAARALQAVHSVVELDQSTNRPDIIYQVAGIYALTAKNRPGDVNQCLFLLNRALAFGYGTELVAIDPELASVRNLPEVQRMVAAAKKWKISSTFGGSDD